MRKTSGLSWLCGAALAVLASGSAHAVCQDDPAEAQKICPGFCAKTAPKAAKKWAGQFDCINGKLVCNCRPPVEKKAKKKKRSRRH